MLLPDKHVRISESLLGLGALIISNLRSPKSFDTLVATLQPIFSTDEWPAPHTSESICLALCFLYAIGIVDVSEKGDLFICA